MPAPLVSHLPPAPSRLSRPESFANESVIFLDALPAFRTQVNELSNYINSIILNKWNYGNLSKQPTFPNISQYEGGGVPTQATTGEYIASVDALYQETTNYSAKLDNVGVYIDMLSNYIGTALYDVDKPIVSDITEPHTRAMSRDVFNYRAELFTESLIDNINSIYQSMWYNYVITFVGDDYGLITDDTITYTDDYGLVTDTNIT